MKNLKFLHGFLIIIGILFITLVNGILINTFSDGLTSSNLTFTVNENQTLNLTIPKNAEIVSSVMNLSGHGVSSERDIEESYSCEGDFAVGDGECVGGVDEDWSGGSGDRAYPDYPGTENTWVYANVTETMEIPSNCDNINIGWTNYVKVETEAGQDINNLVKLYFWNFSSSVYVEKYSYTNINDGDAGSGASNIEHSVHADFINGSNQIKIKTVLVRHRTTGTTNYVSIYREGKLTNLSCFPSSPYVQINNTQIWNHTGEFNSTFSPSQTDDFSSTLNTALNSGACDCDGCVLDGNNCTINFTFHSDTTGILGYSAIDINYTPAPFVTLESPDNDSYSPATKTFNCSATDEEGLTNVTFYFWNSTGALNLSTTINLTGTSNSTTYDMTFNSTETYIWGCSAINNNSREWWADNNFTINVDIDDPIVTLNKPTDLQYINTQNTQFNYTPEHSGQTVDTCELYGNFTGSWLLNQTNTSITEDVVNTFNQTLTDGSYLWNINCNTTETSNSAFAYSNFTFTLDTVKPLVTIDSITTTAGSQTFLFTNNVSDANIDSCKYSIFNSTGGINGLNENISFTCNDSTTPTVTAYGTYNLTIYAIDLALNENSSTLSFTTSASSGTTVTGGGGGASPQIDVVSIIEIENFKKLTDLERAIIYSKLFSYCTN